MKSLIRLVLLLSVATLAAAQQEPAEITGTIRLNGCVANPANLQLRASPVTLYSPADTSSRTPPLGGVAIGRIIPSAQDPHEFSFRVAVREGARGYRLAVRLTSPDCGRVAWTGPPDGLVVAGGPPVTLEAFAIRTQIEILGEGMGRPGPKWVGADHLDFTDPATATRRLRVRSTVPEITSILLQLSTRPFPTSGRTACEVDPPEVIRSIPFSLGGTEVGMTSRPEQWNELPPINFNELLQTSGESNPADTLTPLVLQQLQLGAPLYLRAVPVGTDPARPTDGPQRLCDPSRYGLPGWVRVAKLAKALMELASEPGQPTLKLRSALYRPPVISPWPGGGEQCYSVTQNHVVNPAEGTYDQLFVFWGKTKTGALLTPTYPPGPFCLPCCSSAEGWFDTFVSGAVDLVTGAIDWVSGLVNWISKVYDSVKGAVSNVMVKVIEAVGVDCDATCQGLVEAGIEIGLSSMGMPPDLPNWDALKEEGLEYVAGEIASQTGIPPEVSAKALDYATKAVEKVSENRGGGGGLPPWLSKDFGLQPASLSLTLQKTTPSPLPSMSLMTMGNAAFYSAQVPLPHTFPIKNVDGQLKQLLTVPIVLNPNLAGLPPCPNCSMLYKTDPLYEEWTILWYKQQWADRLKTNLCVPFYQLYWEDGFLGIPVNVTHLNPSLMVDVFSEDPFGPPLPDSGFVYSCYVGVVQP